ncbi:response regulator transcription factor [Pseudolysinimonas yzui]|uniref:DNA-binding response regulator n=1 Tax=Pseudolysinimonas yzui TaxID=2708254 RepID=A0A8J3GQP8_9MICO|nr:response regulator transcription factor [Pseudolysinimonas yzui]GHF16853.1 DNA-binding response regulator [Pseudolysinimonas yzui]
MTHILIVDDEERIISFVRRGLTAAGYATSSTGSGLEALALLRAGGIDLVLLDIGLPDISGLEVLARLRAEGSMVTVIALTARDSARDLVAGLDGGADDYVPKPFTFDELLARIRARLRDRDRAVPTRLEHDGLVLDLLERRATIGDHDIELSAREFALAEELMRHAGQVLSREQLLSRVWGYDFDPGSNVVDVYIRYLRTKLGAERIETVRGAGYRLV